MNIKEQLEQVQKDLDEGKIDWKEARRILMADLKNERERLKRELDAVNSQGVAAFDAMRKKEKL
jgi:hypothetical protein